MKKSVHGNKERDKDPHRRQDEIREKNESKERDENNKRNENTWRSGDSIHKTYKISSKDKRILQTIIIIVVALTIIDVVYIQLSTSYDRSGQITNRLILTKVNPTLKFATGNAVSAFDSGTARICINTPPIITYDCNLTNLTLNSHERFYCHFNASDANHNGIVFASVFMTTPVIFNISTGGIANFTTRKDAQGHINTVRIYAYDNSGCLNNYTYNEYNITIHHENQAPYLSRNLTDQEIIKNQYYDFYLNDYFTDPDSDPLAYFNIYTMGSEGAIVTIGSNGHVEIKGESCGTSWVYYVASDPEGLTAQSNTVQYKITCPQDMTGSSNANAGSGSGHGGGGGQSEACTPRWQCSAWSACSPRNSSHQRCIDYNACSADNYEQYLFKNCTYSLPSDRCTENWQCGEWSTCKNDTHTRLCLEINACDTNDTKPLESDSCISSCFNGLKDKEETGVDCGGPCDACRNVEKPSKTISPILTTTAIAAALALGMTALIAFAYRRNIMTAYEKIFVPRPKSKKRIYLSSKQKEKLLRMLNIAQTRLDKNRPEYAVEDLLAFMQEYLKELLAIDHINNSELAGKIVKLKDKDLEKMLILLYARIVNINKPGNKNVKIRNPQVQALIDEAVHYLYIVSEFTDAEAMDSIKERYIKGKDPLDQEYNDISNIYIALKFGELLVSRSMYNDILKAYDALHAKGRPEDSLMLYNDVIRVFYAIKYLEKQYST
jgi:hypothetical protein